MRYLVDTNILLRFLNRTDPHSTAARAAVRILKARGDETFGALRRACDWIQRKTNKRRYANRL